MTTLKQPQVRGTGAEAAPRPPRWAWPVLGVALVVGVVALLLALAFTGATTPTLLADPGALVRWGLPVVGLVVNLASAVTIGSLVLCAVVLPRESRPAAPGRSRPAAERGRAPRVRPLGAAWPLARASAAVASVVWTLSLCVQLILTYASVSGSSLGGGDFGAELGIFLTRIELGQAMLWALVLTALTSLAAVAASGYTSATWASVMALAALVPVAATGHAAGSDNHELAVGSLYLHVVSAAIWLGGLAVLVLVAGALGRDLRTAVARYSALAIWAYALVAISGVVNGYVRVGTFAALVGTSYGVLLLAKIGATLALGVAGWWHRRRTLPRLGAERDRAFWQLVAGEVVLMAAVMGLAVALAASAPPVADVPPQAPSPAEAIIRRPVPAAPTALTWVTQWRADALVLIGIGCAALVVLRWFLRLRRRGDRWPASRVISLYLGLALIAWVTSGGPAVYGHVLFSAHMVQHMVLVMLAPIFLVLGAPVTLAVRALPAREDGSRGPRELLLGIVKSRWAHAWGQPVVAAANVVISMVVFYYTPLFEYSLTNHLVHLWMIVHFTLAGYLFVNVLIGVDPGPKRPSYPLRLVLLFATMAFHAFFGLALTEGDTLIAARWFGGLGLPWGVDALADQRSGGAFMWGFGELPSLVLAVALGLAWIRDDEKTARRRDRAADRDGEAELAAYNAMLAGMAAEQRPSPSTISPASSPHTSGSDDA